MGVAVSGWPLHRTRISQQAPDPIRHFSHFTVSAGRCVRERPVEGPGEPPLDQAAVQALDVMARAHPSARHELRTDEFEAALGSLDAAAIGGPRVGTPGDRVGDGPPGTYGETLQSLRNLGQGVDVDGLPGRPNTKPAPASAKPSIFSTILPNN